MKIQINEVWNSEGRSEKLTVIEVPDRRLAKIGVYSWVDKNRPDLSMAGSIYDHGFHAVEVAS